MPTNKVIKQDELATILNLRLVAQAAKKQAETARDELDKAEALLIGRLEEKATVQAGPLACGVEHVPGKRIPKWKEEYAAKLGADAVEAVIQGTQPGPGTLRLVIAQGGKVVKTA